MNGDETMETLEESMRPGRLSVGGFLGEKEVLDQILRADDEMVRSLGFTHEQIADRIEYFIKAVHCYPTNEGKLVGGIYLVTGTVYRGSQKCPWGDSMPHSSIDLSIRNNVLGEELRLPGAIVHLIRKHQFYEGKESLYRVDPAKTIRVLGIL